MKMGLLETMEANIKVRKKVKCINQERLALATSWHYTNVDADLIMNLINTERTNALSRFPCQQTFWKF